MAILKRLVILALVFLAHNSASAATLTTDQAVNHVGENATVCGTVASANYAARSKGQPTFLNLDGAYPHQIFTVLIWGSDRSKFGAPETVLAGKHVCATGIIQLFRGVPEIIIHETSGLVQK
jgi:DNA/RNA endonuclease YhcR with UshA esterase domain